MKQLVLKGGLALAAAALATAQPAQAAMSCWNAEGAAAAQLRDLQSRLMVATLRCRAIGVDVLTAYNDFVRENRSTIQAANGVLKAQFVTGYGREGDAAYDRFATALANEYGGDATTGQLCDDTAAAAEEAAAAGGDVTKLLAIAGRFGPAPDLPGGQCPIVFSQR
ncbi:MAG TPA: hypothetical protein VGD66_11910 [Allosphingosinicella sp.]|jgi:hypothetical protein